MLPKNELLQYVYKTADMGVVGIDAVMDYATANPKLKKVLLDQRSEYIHFRDAAQELLSDIGEGSKGVNAMAKVSAEVMSTGQLLLDHSPSKIAEMTIQGNNMGVSKTIQHLHDYVGNDEARRLTERLLETEKANVEQLKPFL